MSVKIGRNDPCWCGSGRKYKACHEAFDEKIARYASQGHIVPQRNIIKNAEQIAGIKESCKINIAVLDYIEKNIHEGMNTAEIDKIVYDMTTSMGGIPAPLNYEGYPFFYSKKYFTVDVEGKEKYAFLYVMNNDNDYHIPSDEYVEICKKGYKDFNFDEAILDKAYSDTCKNIKKLELKR